MIFELWLITMASFLLGWFLRGINFSNDELFEKPSLMAKNIKLDAKKRLTVISDKITGEELQVGAVPRPTAREMALWDEDPKKQEAKEEMRKSLDEIPELRQAKEYVESMRR